MSGLSTCGLAGLLLLQSLGCASERTVRESHQPPLPASLTIPREHAPFAPSEELQDRAQEPAPGQVLVAELSEGEQAAIELVVLAELRAYYKDFSARNWPLFREHFWPGASITTLGQPSGESRERVVVTSVEAFIEKPPGGTEVFEQTIVESEGRYSRDLAQVWIRYRARFGSPGEVMEWTGTEAFTLLYHDSCWRIVALAYVGDH